MGQKEKALGIVETDYEFTTTTGLGPGEVTASAVRAAEAFKGGLGAGIRHLGDEPGQNGSALARFSVRGVGGFKSLMDFAVIAEANREMTTVALEVENFVFEKGSLGMKPTINAKPAMQQFLKEFKSALGQGRAS